MPYVFEKRSGPDWVVEVLLSDDDEIYPVSVFGAADEAAAVREALSSFTYRTTDEMTVISVIRQD
jgi:hypothetical protein